MSYVSASGNELSSLLFASMSCLCQRDCFSVFSLLIVRYLIHSIIYSYVVWALVSVDVESRFWTKVFPRFTFLPLSGSFTQPSDLIMFAIFHLFNNLFVWCESACNDGLHCSFDWVLHCFTFSHLSESFHPSLFKFHIYYFLLVLSFISLTSVKKGRVSSLWM